MRGARYERSPHGAKTAHWPFAMPDAMPAFAWVAPEFRANLERILSTSRSYLRIEVPEGRQVGTKRRSRRR